MIYTVEFVDPQDGALISYDGIFDFDRSGGYAEVSIPVDDDEPTAISEVTADNLEDRVDHIVIARRSEKVESSGIVDAIDQIEDQLVVRIDDAQWLSAREVANMDVSADVQG